MTTVTTTTRPEDKLSHQEAMMTPIAKVALQLLEILGARLAAMVIGLSDPKALSSYIKEGQKPQGETERRLRLAHQIVVRLMKGGVPRESVQSWFVGMNPELNDEAPAKVILDDPKRVLDAARAFVEA